MSEVFSTQRMNNECIIVTYVAQGFGHLRTYQEDLVLYDNTGAWLLNDPQRLVEAVSPLMEQT